MKNQLLELKENLQIELKEKEELNNRLENVTQENKDLLHKVSSLEETVSSADSESKTIQQRVNALTEERNAVENEVTSLRESLQTLETEKQVCCFLIALRVVNLYLFCLVCLILYSPVFFSLDTTHGYSSKLTVFLNSSFK